MYWMYVVGYVVVDVQLYYFFVGYVVVVGQCGGDGQGVVLVELCCVQLWYVVGEGGVVDVVVEWVQWFVWNFVLVGFEF